MTQKLKRPCSLLLVVMMVVGLFTAIPMTAGATEVVSVTWKNWDGTVLEIDENVAEGTIPTYDGTTPTKPDVEKFSYTFAGWNKELKPVSEDVTYTAVFEETDTTGITIYRNGLSLSALKVGDILRPGASFSYVSGEANVTLLASRYANSSNEIQTTDTALLTSGYYSANVSVESNNSRIYRHAVTTDGKGNWYTLYYPIDENGNSGNAWEVLSATVEDGVSTIVLQGTNYPIDHTYTVRWCDENGNQLYAENFGEESIPSYTGSPLTKAEDETYRYTLYWTNGVNEYADGKLPMMTKNITYTAFFKAVSRLEGKIYTVGQTIDFGELTYMFNNSSSTVALSGEQQYSGAVYSIKGNSYAVTLGTQTMTVRNQMTNFGSTPEITFVSGDGCSATTAYQMVCLGDVFDGAIYTSGDYINFGETGITIGNQTLTGAVGITAIHYDADTSECTLSMSNGMTLPVTVKNATNEIQNVRILWDTPNTYHFEAVTKSDTAIKVGDIYYNGDTINFGNDCYVKTDVGTYHEKGNLALTVGALDRRRFRVPFYFYTADNDYDYQIYIKFAISQYTTLNKKTLGLYVSAGTGTEDDPFILELAYDTVVWKNYDGTVLEIDNKVEENTVVSYDGNVPTKESTEIADFTFIGWTDGGKTTYTADTLPPFTSSVNYTAKYSYTLKQCTVIWKNEDGTVLKTDENVIKGTIPAYDGVTPAKADYAEYRYIFSGWTDGTTNYSVEDTLPIATEDVTYTATFTTASRFEETVDEKSPTCVEDGNIAYFVDYDGKYYTFADGEYTEVSAQDVVIPATGIHTAGEPVKENEVAPTYESEGSYEEVVYCSVCGEELSRQTVVVPMRKLIDVTELYMNNGGMYSAVLDIPEGDTYKIKSNDISVASVNSAGRIVARGEGTTEIEIITSSGMHVVCTVEVTDVNNITLDKSELVMNVKDSYTFTATYPDTETCAWKSSDPNVVTVDLNGKIVARGEGTATIYARTQSSIATCEITVNKAPKEIILDKTELSLNSSTKEMYTLKVTLSPEDAQTTLTFKSSNPSVASVNSKGRIVARGEGTATIKVISTNGKVATCTVQVS